MNKRSRENAEEYPAEHQKEALRHHRYCQPGAEVCGLPHQGRSQRGSSTSWRVTRLWAACKLGRDAEFQAIMPVRGKILNCLKADYGKIFKSDIITDLIKVLGCGVEVHDKRAKDLATFDLANLRWNKIVICTDADVDGFQIRTLILTMLYRLTPTLIQQGYVYIAESPLYEITAKGKTYFAYTEPEKAKVLRGDRKRQVHHPALQRSGRKRPGYDVADHHEP